MKLRTLMIGLGLGIAATLFGAVTTEQLQREVRHQLVMQPYYRVFDNLTYKVQGNDVTLAGQVTTPTLKNNAEKAVESIEGVGKVTNNIEVLPVSSLDDQIRIATFQAIYSKPALQRYAFGAVPPIHIIVKNGHVTLEGMVLNEADKNMAGIAAKGVPNVFSVDNHLQTEAEK